MSIQRYESYDAWEADEYEGRYVLYADHVAAVAEAERLHLTHYEDGIKAERARIGAAVEALRIYYYGEELDLAQVKGYLLSIIDGDADA